MKKSLKWNFKELIVAVFGIFLYSLSIKFFINPNHLYSGGIMGLSQLLRTIIVFSAKLKISFDISIIIYYILNVPLFIIAYKKMGKTFFYRTLFCVTLNTIFLLLIPEIKNPVTDNILTNIIIGGFLCGIGTGALLSIGASTGGTDIIGVLLTKKYRVITVGGFNLIFNIVIYTFSGIVGGLETLIYSVLYSVIDSVTVDKTHLRNVCATMFIFSKKKPTNIINYIINNLQRDATYWEAVGGYKKDRTYITYTFLTKLERFELESVINELDKDSFIVMNNGGQVKGLFDKKI